MIPRSDIESQNKTQKRYGLTMLLIAILSGVIVGQVVWLSPDQVADFLIPGGYVSMAVPISLWLFLMIAVLTGSTRRAIVWTTLTLLWLYLRVYGLGNVINGLLLAGMGVSWEVYSKKQ
jgi:hypothetical protein